MGNTIGSPVKAFSPDARRNELRLRRGAEG
jgi:hypothetical protein